MKYLTAIRGVKFRCRDSATRINTHSPRESSLWLKVSFKLLAGIKSKPKIALQGVILL